MLNKLHLKNKICAHSLNQSCDFKFYVYINIFFTKLVTYRIGSVLTSVQWLYLLQFVVLLNPLYIDRGLNQSIKVQI
jgi:hypothetical protein